MRSYRAYGLVIVSDTAIPELPASDGACDDPRTRVRVALRSRGRLFPEPSSWFNIGRNDAGEVWLKCARISEGYLLRYSGLADFVIARDGSAITCVGCAPEVSELTLRHLLLDQAFPRLLNLLGREALHATAITTPCGVCAFIGPAGTGKSTLAASFQVEGYNLVCDDCLVLEDGGGRIFAVPGYPGVRLWQDSLEAFAGKMRDAGPVAQYTSKSRLLGPETPRRFTFDRLPLARVYLLTRDQSQPEPNLTRLSPAEIFPLLVESSFPLDTQDQAMLMRHFRLFSRVAAEIPSRRLDLPNDFNALGAVHRSILNDLEQS